MIYKLKLNDRADVLCKQHNIKKFDLFNQIESFLLESFKIREETIVKTIKNSSQFGGMALREDSYYARLNKEFEQTMLCKNYKFAKYFGSVTDHEEFLCKDSIGKNVYLYMLFCEYNYILEPKEETEKETETTCFFFG